MTITTGKRTTTPTVAPAGVSKVFGDLRAVDGLDLEPRQGETVALLGPGCDRVGPQRGGAARGQRLTATKRSRT